MHGKRNWLIVMALLALAPFLVTDTLAKKGGAKPKPPPETPADPAIAYVVGNNTLKVMNADGSNQAQLYQDTSHWVSSPSWSADGKHVAYVDENNYASEPNAFLWRIDVAVVDGKVQASNRTVLVNDREVWWARWSPGASEIAFIAESTSGNVYSRQVRVVSATGGTQTVLYTPPSGHLIKCVEWGPDGDRIAFMEQDTSEGVWYVCVLDRDTPSDVTTVDIPRSEGHQSIGGISWAKTQDVLAYSEGVKKTKTKGKKVTTWVEYNIHVLDLDTGDTAELVAGRTPTWSPDDEFLMWGGITKYELATDETTNMVDGGWPEWRWF